jgi:hypothetical protein
MSSRRVTALPYVNRRSPKPTSTDTLSGKAAQEVLKAALAAGLSRRQAAALVAETIAAGVLNARTGKRDEIERGLKLQTVAMVQQARAARGRVAA